MTKKMVGILGTVLVSTSLSFNTADAAHAQSLSYQAACNIPGSFTHSGTVHMDGSRIYAVSTQGTLWVLDKSTPCKVLENLPLTGAGLGSVNGNNKQLYVAGRDGNVWTYNKTSPLTLVSVKQVSQYQLLDLEVMGVTVYVGLGQVSMAVDGKHVYLSALNPGEVVESFSRGNLSPIVYGQNFLAGTTAIYDRKTGNLLSTINNPSTNAVDLRVDRKYLAITAFATPGVYLYNIRTFQQTFIPRWYANVVAELPAGLMLVGDEYGQVGLYRLASGYPLLANLDLRAITGRFESEAIEVRDIATDGSLVVAASSWGNDLLRSSPNPPPSIFYLRLQ